MKSEACSVESRCLQLRQAALMLLAGMLFVLSFILAFRGFRPTWGDETFTLRLLLASWEGFREEIARDVHPPLYFALTKVVAGILGISRVRPLVQLIFLVLVWTALRLTRRRIESQSDILFPVLLIASSAHLHLFGPMMRYYSLAAIGVTASTLLLLSPAIHVPLFGRKPILNRAVWYGVFLWIAIASSYLTLVIVPAHLIHILAMRRSETCRFRLVMLAALFFSLPFVPLFLAQMSNVAATWPGLSMFVIKGLARLAFTVYSFGIGEFIRPWDWWLSIPALLAFCRLGYLAWTKRATRLGGLLWLTLATSIPLGVLALAKIGVGIEFTASRLFFLAPLFLILLGLGPSDRVTSGLKGRIGHVAIAVLVAVNVASTYHYRNGTHSLQSTYVIPWAGIAADIDSLSDRPDSTMLLYDDPTITWWLPDRLRDSLDMSSLLGMPLVSYAPGAPVERPATVIALYSPRVVSDDDVRTYVWYIFDKEPVMTRSIEYVQEDETSVGWKSMLLGRPVYEAKKKLVVYNAAG